MSGSICTLPSLRKCGILPSGIMFNAVGRDQTPTIGMEAEQQGYMEVARIYVSQADNTLWV